MAYWTQQGGWQSYSLPTDAKTDYWGGDFAASFPHTTADAYATTYPYRDANSYSNDFPANRAVTTTFWVKIDNKGKANISWTAKDGWDAKTLSHSDNNLGEKFGFFDKLSDAEKNSIRNERTTLVSNNTENDADPGRRQAAANAYNQTQSTSRNTAANNYNNSQNASRQSFADQYNTANSRLNTKNQTINSWSNSTKSKLSTVKGGDYKTTLETLNLEQLDSLRNQGLLGDDEYKKLLDNSVDSFNTFYLKEKVTPWDSAKFGIQPLAGGFDPSYYKETSTGKEALQKWNEAQQNVNVNGVSLPDLDITARYNQESFLHKYYTDVGKASGDRGNAPIDANLPKTYEEKLTDADYQLYRDQVLGLATEQNPQTVLEGSLGTVLTAKDKQKQQMFGALTQDSLKASLEELKKAKKQESTLSLFRGLPGYDEIFSLNTTLSNSLLGDSGVGGLLSITKNTEDVQKSLEKTLGGVTGVNTSNSAVYNWQQWFDNVLLKRYENGLTVQDPADAEAQYEIDKEFAGKFISDYLKPRFDTSRSMDEFVSYMDVTQKEENIFQTQSALDSLRTLADVRAKAYLDGVQGKAALNFNPDFYFNPGENEQRTEDYAKQTAEVAGDWEAAKKGDPFWAAEAYRYGIDLNDKAQFAKLHYEVKGAKQGFDAARDVITLKDAKEYIDKTIIPAVEAKEVALGDTAFLQFVTPEEFADKLIEGVSPGENKEEWLKLLEQFGLKDTGQSVDELKTYIVDALRTGAAKDIRESIKYLNEKKKTPSQEELGVSYIERPEDKKTLTSANETQLYKVFKDAGYQGTEDEFYTNFMPDVDRGEQVALTKAGAGSGFDFKGLNTSDPFASLMSLGSLFEEPSTTESKTSTTKTTTDKTSSSSSYFKLFEDETEDEALKKSKTGQQILGEFTSMFKGFT